MTEPPDRINAFAEPLTAEERIARALERIAGALEASVPIPTGGTIMACRHLWHVEHTTGGDRKTCRKCGAVEYVTPEWWLPYIEVQHVYF